MKSPTFRLEPVLRIRRIEERAAALGAAQAASLARQAEETAADLDRAASTDAIPAVSSGAGFAAAMIRTRARAADAAAAHAQAVAQQEVAAQAHAEWTAAAQRMKGLERLRERHLASVQRAAEQAEVRAVDDLVTRAYAVRPRPGGQQ